MAKVSESILVVSGSEVPSTESTANESAAAKTAMPRPAAVSLTAVESSASPLLPLSLEKGMVGSAIMKMKADSSMNMTVLVLIANAGCKFTELKPNNTPYPFFSLLF